MNTYIYIYIFWKLKRYETFWNGMVFGFLKEVFEFEHC